MLMKQGPEAGTTISQYGCLRHEGVQVGFRFRLCLPVEDWQHGSQFLCAS